MSYCVNCGVELDNSAKACALCDAPVLNPYVDDDEETITPYSDKVYIPASVSKRYIAFIITVILIIPNIVCSITNLIFPDTGIWAVYLNTTSLLCFILFILPFMFKKVSPYLLLLLDTISIMLYIYFFYSMFEERNWFLLIAVPLVVALGIIIACFLIWIYKKKRDWPFILINLLISISIFSVFTELLFHSYYHTEHILRFSLIIVVSCICLSIFFAFVEKNKTFRAWLSKRFFV
ncbi:MAG: hypothetical protein RR911_04820 [Oscillospiraceae bacterium]